MPVVGASDVSSELALGSGVWLFATLLVAPMALALLVEPWVHAWSDRVDRQRLLIGALLAAAASLLSASVAGHPVVLSACLGLWGLSTGVACGVAQACLVAGARDERSAQTAMTRWSLATSVGDAAAPLWVGGLAALGFGWRVALGAAASTSVLAAWAAWRSGRPGSETADDDRDEDEGTVVAGLRAALSDRTLLAWVAAMAACTLLDEIVLVFVALRLDGEP